MPGPAAASCLRRRPGMGCLSQRYPREGCRRPGRNQPATPGIRTACPAEPCGRAHDSPGLITGWRSESARPASAKRDKPGQLRPRGGRTLRRALYWCVGGVLVIAAIAPADAGRSPRLHRAVAVAPVRLNQVATGSRGVRSASVLASRRCRPAGPGPRRRCALGWRVPAAAGAPGSGSGCGGRSSA